VDSDRSAGARKEIIGTVTDVLPSALYRVRLDEGTRPIVAHVADRMDRNFIRILVGDRVRVELSPVDAGRGRIVEKLG
jgi:translation initiation factor IF-1